MSKSTRGSGIAVFAAAALLAACSSTGASPSSSTQASADTSGAPAATSTETASCTTPVDLKYLTNWDGTPPQDLPFWVALDKGYFTDQCLNVTSEFGAGSTQVAQLVAAGQYDIGNMSSAALVQVKAQNATPLKSVFQVLPKDNGSWIFFESSGITEPKDLEGKRLGTTAGSNMISLLPAFGEAAGFDASKVDMQAVQISNRFALLKSGDLDATTVNLGEPANGTLAQEGPTGRFVLSDYLPILGYSIVANDKVIGEKSDAVAHFVAAMQQAVSDLISDPEAGVKVAADSIQKRVKSPPSVDLIVEQAAPAIEKLMVYDEGHPVGWTSEDAWTKMVQTLSASLKLTTSPAVDDLMTNQFVEAAAK